MKRLFRGEAYRPTGYGITSCSIGMRQVGFCSQFPQSEIITFFLPNINLIRQFPHDTDERQNSCVEFW
ncbi:MAG: hypothetical protein LBJ00_02210 [Planctomycetaceae bacterium]|nr:hypothetical protein [Planctomycetaceae bacterium]